MTKFEGALPLNPPLTPGDAPALDHTLLDGLRHLLETTYGIWVVDREGRTTQVNPRLAGMLGTTPEALLGRPFFDFIEEGKQQDAADKWQRRLTGDRELHEFQFRRDDGLPLWAMVSASPILDANGEVRSVVALLADVSATRRLQREAEHQRARFEQLFRQAHVAMALLDRGDRVIEINGAFTRTFGYALGELRGRTLSSVLVPPEGEQEARDLFARASRDGGAPPVLTTRRHKDGRLLHVEASASYTDGPGASIAVMYIDVTSTVESRARLEEMARALEHRAYVATTELSELAAGMDATMEGMALLRGDEYSYMNAAHADMFGYAPGELLGQSWQRLYEPAQVTFFLEEVFPALQYEGHWRGEVCGRRRDGSAVDLEISLTRASSGMLVCAARDITTRKQNQELMRETAIRLDQANAALQRAARMKDEFLANMSHELRTPLHAISGSAEMLADLSLVSADPRASHLVKTVDTSARHLLSLINDILDLSKIAAGRTELEVGRVSTTELVQSSLSFVREKAVRKKIALVSSVTEAPQVIQGDGRRLRQILVNLLDNAVKFTPEGGEVSLHVRGHVDGTVALSVADTGLGIEPDQVERLFLPFEQLDNSLSRDHGGTGLGLPLVKALAQLHGGTVSVNTVPGRGSRFEVSLPQSAVPIHQTPPPHRPSPPPEAPAAPAEPKASPLVLVVDDHPVNRTLACDMLRMSGFRIEEAASGAEALAVVARQRPDVILMDIQMPGMTGLDAIALLRASPDQRTAGVPIIAMTAHAMVGDRERFLAGGADYYLPRPVSLKQMTATVRAVLNASSPGTP